MRLKLSKTNPVPATKPSCPKAFMQFQHGQVTENADGSLMLKPIAVDGRQLMSDPCQFKNGIYTRYNQTENFSVRDFSELIVSFTDLEAEIPSL